MGEENRRRLPGKHQRLSRTGKRVHKQLRRGRRRTLPREDHHRHPHHRPPRRARDRTHLLLSIPETATLARPVEILPPHHVPHPVRLLRIRRRDLLHRNWIFTPNLGQGRRPRRVRDARTLRHDHHHVHLLLVPNPLAEPGPKEDEECLRAANICFGVVFSGDAAFRDNTTGVRQTGTSADRNDRHRDTHFVNRDNTVCL